MILREREDTGNWKRNHYIALSGELALEEATDLSSDCEMNEQLTDVATHTVLKCKVTLGTFSREKMHLERR
jgi:hypothetical protein